MAQLRRLLGTKAGRDAFKKELQDILGDGGSVTVGAPRSLGLGDDSLEFPIKMHDSELDLTLAFAYIRVDRVVDSLFIASPRSLGLFAAAKTLGRLMVTRTRSELAPKNTSLPTITGTPQVGQVLTASAGTWGGTPRFAYQWLRCGATGPCSPIAGATAATYTPTDADVGSTLRVAVTATNPQGSKTAQSAATAVVTAVPAPPANTAPPTVAGTPQQGQTLTANPGTWTGSPTFAYQWQRCDSAGTCTDIPGATAQTYVVTPSDIGFSLRVVVTATNAFGSTKATSAPTAAAT
jgi:hypothetical protein